MWYLETSDFHFPQTVTEVQPLPCLSVVVPGPHPPTTVPGLVYHGDVFLLLVPSVTVLIWYLVSLSYYISVYEFSKLRPVRWILDTRSLRIPFHTGQRVPSTLLMYSITYMYTGRVRPCIICESLHPTYFRFHCWCRVLVLPSCIGSSYSTFSGLLLSKSFILTQSFTTTFYFPRVPTLSRIREGLESKTSNPLPLGQVKSLNGAQSSCHSVLSRM